MELKFLQTKEPKTLKGEAFIAEPRWIVHPSRKACGMAPTGVHHTGIVFKLSPATILSLFERLFDGKIFVGERHGGTTISSLEGSTEGPISYQSCIESWQSMSELWPFYETVQNELAYGRFLHWAMEEAREHFSSKFERGHRLLLRLFPCFLVKCSSPETFRYAL
eukprot:gene5631-6204_t